MRKSIDLNSNMNDYVENILAENLTLKRKLESKSEALLILTKELSDSRAERDQFKLIAEELQQKYISLRKNTSVNRVSWYSDNHDDTPVNSVKQNLSETKEANRSLKFEVDDLRQKLRDAVGDIKALRSKLNHQKQFNYQEPESSPQHLDKQEELVKQLEIMNTKKSQLELDLQSVLDEKEELVTERDAYKCKVHRLNHQLNNLLKGDNQNLIDLDALIMENRFLQERQQQAHEEIQLANQTISKYKCMLEKKRSKGSVKLGTSNSSGMLISQKQVQDLLENGTPSQLPNTPATVADLRSLCLALLESLSDKSLALSHQKKANRILAAKICELEQRIESFQGARVVNFPSQLLLDGYTSADVYKDVEIPITRLDSSRTSSSSSEHVVTENPLGLDTRDGVCRSDQQEDEEEDQLPPELKQLVINAMEEIDSEAKRNISS